MMKKILLLFALLGTMTFTACDDEDAGNLTYEQIDYTGVLSVIPISGGDTYTWNDTHFSLLQDYDGTLTLWMYETRFVPGMPAMDMAVPGITYANSAAMTSLLGDNIVPYMGGTPYERYLVTNLSGTVADNQLNIAFNCMGFRVNYIGTQD